MQVATPLCSARTLERLRASEESQQHQVRAGSLAWALIGKHHHSEHRHRQHQGHHHHYDQQGLQPSGLDNNSGVNTSTHQDSMYSR